MDLFASRLNCQIKPFVSWHPDPEASAVDAFTIVWKEDLHYAFPPFSLIQAVIRKVEEDEAEIILILPNWPTACWFPQMLNLLVAVPVLLPKGRSLLSLPHVNMSSPHPLHKRLQLLAVRLSGKLSRRKAFMGTCAPSCVPLGGNQLINSTIRIFRDGSGFVKNGMYIPFERL